MGTRRFLKTFVTQTHTGTPQPQVLNIKYMQDPSFKNVIFKLAFYTISSVIFKEYFIILISI